MKVLVIGGPGDGDLVDRRSQDVEFVHKEERYSILYEVFGVHPTQPTYKSAAAFAVPTSMIFEACSGAVGMEPEHLAILRDLQEWRYMPRFRGEAGH